MKGVEILRKSLYSVIEQAESGHGSFVSIDVSLATNKRASLWIYLCGWAITKDGYERLSSESRREELDATENILSEFRGKKIIDIVELDENEVHICLEGSIVIEIWRESDIYDGEPEIIRFYEDGHYVGSVI